MGILPDALADPIGPLNIITRLGRSSRETRDTQRVQKEETADIVPANWLEWGLGIEDAAILLWRTKQAHGRVVMVNAGSVEDTLIT